MPSLRSSPRRMPMSGRKHTVECRKRLDDAMTTDTSTASRVQATRVRLAERITTDLDDSRAQTPAVQVALVNTNGSSFQIKSTWVQTREGTSGQEASVTRKRSAETDAERLEHEAPETAEIDFDKRTALKRKAEGDPSDSEMKDSAMNSLAELMIDYVGALFAKHSQQLGKKRGGALLENHTFQLIRELGNSDPPNLQSRRRVKN